MDVQRYGIDHGLAHQVVTAIWEDESGFVWVGTPQGLHRFDGYEFLRFSEDSHGIASNEVDEILQDSDGWLWLLTYKERNSFEKELFRSSIEQICIFHPNTYEVRNLESHLGGEAALFDRTLLRSTCGPDGTLYFGTLGEKVLQVQKGKASLLTLPDCKATRPMYVSKDKDLVVAGKDKDNRLGSYLLKHGGDRFKVEKIWENAGIVVGSQDREGLWLFDHDHHGISCYQEGEPTRKVKFSTLEERERNYHGAVLMNGAELMVEFFDNKAEVFVRIRPDSFASRGYYDIPAVTRLVQANNAQHSRSYFGGQPSLTALEIRPNPFRQLLASPRRVGEFAKYTRTWGLCHWDSLLYINVRDAHLVACRLSDWKIEDVYAVEAGGAGKKTLMKDYADMLRSGEELLMVRSDHVLAFRPADGRSRKLVCPEDPDADFNTIYRDEWGKHWVGGKNGRLYTWKSEEGALSPWPGRSLLPEEAVVVSFLALERNNLMVATSEGIYVIDLENEEATRYHSAEAAPRNMPFDNYTRIYRDQEGTIWLATRGGGLIRWEFEKEDKPTQQFTMNEGLSSNTLYSIHEDDNGQLWMPSDQGLIRFDKANSSSISFQESDGLSHYEFNTFSDAAAPDGSLFFGGRNGVVAFHPSQFQDTLGLSGELQLTSFMQFDGQQEKLVDKTAAFYKEREITVRPGDGFFTLKFSFLKNPNLRKLRYAYRLDGQDMDWNYNTGNSIRFSGLDYGEYVLQIRAQLENGPLSKQELRIPIHVLRPFYSQNWFLIACVLLLGLLVYLFIRLRTRQLRKRQAELEHAVAERTKTIGQQAEELKQLDKTKSRFFANVSHELRTPLTLMLGPLRTVLQKGKLDARSRDYVALAEENSESLLSLVNEILTLSKMESGKMQLREEPTALYPLLRRLVSNFESHGDLLKLQLDLDYQPDRYLQILLDTGKFERILNNFLSNAFKHTPQGGRISVSLSELPNRLLLKVTDTGTGIPPAVLPHVFDRFFQHSDPQAPAQGGTGIGLALCKEIAQLMRGKVWAESDGESGSAFCFEFPKREILGIVEDEPEEEETLQETPVVLQEPTGERARLLVVEDNPSLAAYLQLILSGNYEVVVARNGLEAWEMLESETSGFDLVVSDIMMPLMDGYQLLEKLKTDQRFRLLPVIMLTARADIADKLRALRIGVDDYLLKPFVEEELLARIENLLANSRARKVEGEKEVEKEKPAEMWPEDAAWLEKLEGKIGESLGDMRFNAEELAYEMGMVRQTLNRRLKKLTGLTTTKFIQEAKMQRARTLLEERRVSTVKAASLEVGIKDVRYFSSQFKERFGKLPSGYLK